VYCLELVGEEDRFAAREAEAAATAIERVAPGVATARGIDRARAQGLAYTRFIFELVGTSTADIEAARLILEAASFDRTGSIAVRARDVRASTEIDTQTAERVLGSVLVDHGFTVDLNDPDHVLRAVFSEGSVDGEERSRCLLGWLAVETKRDFTARKPTDRPFFQPGSMAPMDARAFVNLAGGGPDTTVLDPMCGTGGVLLEAGLLGARPIGVDAQAKMVRGARTNLEAYVADRDAAVIRGDATDLPLRDGSIDAVVFDAPYGRQSKIARHGLAELVSGALTEARRVAPRAVMIADRSWVDEAEAAGWTLADRFVRRVHRSLDRHVHVLR